MLLYFPESVGIASRAEDGAGFDVVFEVAGTDAPVHAALQLARAGTRVVLAGIPDNGSTTFHASLARRKGLTLVLVRRMAEVYPRARDLATRGLVDLTSLVTSTFAITNTADAMESAASRSGLKVVIHPQQS